MPTKKRTTKKTTKKTTKTTKVAKRRMGRPTKLTPKFLRVAEEILLDDINTVIFTDEELREMINEKLEEKERVSETRWEEWKAGNLKDPIIEEFRGLILKALRIQKASLFDAMRKDDKAWTRYAWIIERKFDHWNLRKKTEVTGKDGGAVELVALSNYRDKAKNIKDEQELQKLIADQNRDK